jgi:hypothetical protein
VAIVALALWTLTVAVGVYLLVSSTRLKPETAAEATVPAREAATVPAGGAAIPAPARKKRDQFDPPSLRAAKSEPVPGMRALAEFTHPALAITGFAFWLLYAMVHDRIFAVIGLGIILGAVAAGVSWAVSNSRSAKRGDGYALSFSGRVLAFHVAGAALTLLLVALITAGV